MIRDIENETQPRKDLEALQLKRPQAVVQRVYPLVPFYRRLLDAAIQLLLKEGIYIYKGKEVYQL